MIFVEPTLVPALEEQAIGTPARACRSALRPWRWCRVLCTVLLACGAAKQCHCFHAPCGRRAGRVHRLGQLRPPTVHRLLLAGTVEVAIARAAEHAKARGGSDAIISRDDAARMRDAVISSSRAPGAAAVAH